jgi:mannose-6-phosphate isomerase
LLPSFFPKPDAKVLEQVVPPEPFRIEPTFSPRIWGARSLRPIYADKTDLADPIGEAWLTDLSCRVVTGAFTGRSLSEAWREMPADWRGAKFVEPGDFPLLLKFIFPTDKLSIQVHPDDAYAAVHEKAAGGRGKTEMWHVLSAKPGAHLLAGLKSGVTKEAFRQALDSQNLEDLLESHKVHAGDTFFIPAGTPHTIGPGMIICEVQQYSDLTYRVYDYGRVDVHGKSRELHIEKALEVINFNATFGGKVTPRRCIKSKENGGLHHLVDCSYFSVDRLDIDGMTHFTAAQPKTGEDHFFLLVVLAGEGTLSWSSTTRVPRGAFQFKQGECWFVPAGAFGSHCYRSTAAISLLTASVP